MARQGLAALTGGYMEGAEFVDDRKKAKQVRELLGHENVRLRNREKAVGRFGDEFDFDTLPIPASYDEKLLGGIPPAQQQAIQPQQMPSAETYALPTQTIQPAQPFADGGAVRHLRKAYADGGKAEKAEKSRLEAFNAAADRALPSSARAMEEHDRIIEEKRRAITAPGRTTAERGKSTRDFLWEGIKGAGALGRGLLEDTGGPRVVGEVGKFIGGVLGYGLDEGQVAAAQAIPREETPEEIAPEATAPPAAPAGQATRAATPAASSNIQGAEEVDFSTQAREIMPEDLPAHSSKDWEEERRYWAAYAVSQGQDPFQAMKKVDEQQTAGFSRYAMQATALIDGGDMEGAARSLYAAYQFFPNGKNVKFGIQRGKDGQRVIVAMGSDEKSGKSSGPPQVVNSNTISRMVENMQKPGALRAWTTDWQKTEGKLWEQGYKQDVLKETGRHNRRTEEIGAAAAAAKGRSGGLKETTKLTAARDFRGSMEMFGFEGEEESEQARFLTGIMDQLYIAGYGNRSSNTIINDVRDAYKEGKLLEFLQQQGIDVDAEQ